MFCGKCGKEIENNAAVCKWCGEPTGADQNPQAEYRKTAVPQGKTVLGVSIGLLSAGAYWLGMASELAAILLIVYILLKEKNPWLKENALKAGVIIIGFAVLQGMIGIVSDGITGFKSLFSMAITFDYYNTPFDKLCSFLSAVCSVGKNVLLLIAGYRAFHYQSFKISIVDRIVDSNMERE